MKKLLFCFFSCVLLLSSGVVTSQVLKDSVGQTSVPDSAKRAQDSTVIVQVTQPTLAGVPVSQPVQTLVIAILGSLATMLPMLQYLLKKIPTPVSVKLCGLIGKLLDIVTWFQKDMHTNGTVHGQSLGVASKT